MATSYLTVGLDKGLNSVVPPVLAEHGTLRDSLNYEVVPQIGYKKIDGYERYDGFQSAGFEQVYRVVLTGSSAGFAVGDVLYLDATTPFATVVGVPNAITLDYVQLGYTEQAIPVTALRKGSAGASMNVSQGPTSITELTSLTASEGFSLMRQYMQALRNLALPLPSDVVGLHWFEDRLYAVAGSGATADLYYSVDEYLSQELGLARGWHKIDAGRFVEFNKGLSTADSLTLYSRAFSSQVEDPRPSPTPISTFLSIKQGTSFAGEATVQGKGWKPSSAPNTYNIAASDVAAADTNNIFADAMLQWVPGVDFVNIQGGYRTAQLTQADPAYKLGGLTIGGTATTRDFGASNAYTTFILEGLNGLGDNLPLNAEISGIEAEVEYVAEVLMHGKNIAGDATPVSDTAFDIIQAMNLRGFVVKNAAGAYTKLGSGSSSSLVVDKPSFTQYEAGTKTGGEQWRALRTSTKTVTVGGADDLFGNQLLTYADLVSTFGLGFTVEPTVNTKPAYADKGAAAYRLRIDRVRVKVHFKKKSSFYYIVGTDGAVMKGTLTSYGIEYGNLATGDAKGSAHFYGLTSVVGTRLVPQAGDKVYAYYPVESGDLPVFELLSSTVASLPGLTRLEEENSRYLFRSANFYGDAGWDAMYGVSGAGRAFFWDGHVLGFVMTQYDLNKDMPRHVAVHHNHLVLGFKSGSVQLSVIGEPSNFSGVDGASEWPMGDDVTGLLSLNGTTLGVFCKGSVHSLAGSSVQNFSQQTISPKQGAIEYSVVDMGQPMYATTNGISTLEQTAAYGDFVGRRSSDQVATWLPKRLLGSDKRANTIGVVCAMPVRAKNQYRLFFKDGLVLSLTMMGENSPVMTSKYAYNKAALIPRASSSEIDHVGRERLFVAGYKLPSSGSWRVFELDSGWGFDGEWFPHHLELTPIFPSNGTNMGSVDQIRMHGQSKGLATLNVRVEGVEESYMDPFTYNTQDLSMPINPERYKPTLYPSMSIVDHASWGLGLKILIQGTEPANLTEIEPSHICQVLLLHITADGARDN